MRGAAQFDASLAREELGWEATTALVDGIRLTFDYFKSLTQV
jgi:nucleoside-diphosphate-sugar epimerase